ncbi:MAG TPA: peptidase M24 family protein, partial [Lactobacillus sp.]|nr:peptidase M24 family protein [Lactobacillus sp.]
MDRMTALQARILDKKLDGFFVTDATNVTYLTGFTGEESALLVTPEKAYFITDSRFTEQFKQEVHNAKLVLHQDGLFKTAGDLANQLQLTRIGFEAVHLNYADYEAFDLLTQGTLVPTRDFVETQREVKDDEELALIKKAVAIAEKGYQHVLDTIKPGMREIDIANDLDFFMRQLGASNVSFETIVASGTRSAMPHGSATEKKIAKGDIVTLDWGCIYHGYMSDLTRTFAVGEPDAKLKTIYQIVYVTNQKVQQALKPGVMGRTINDLAHNAINDAGYGQYFGHGTGHGIGLSIHEGPGAWG